MPNNNESNSKSSSETRTDDHSHHTPFSYEHVPPKMCDRNHFKKYHDDELKKWADSLDAIGIQKVILNLVDSLIERAENGKVALASISLVLMADPCLEALQYLARTNETLAADHLVSILKRAIDRLNHNDEANNKVLKNSAPSKIFWPINYSPNSFLSTTASELMSRINIGGNYFLKIKSDKGTKGQPRSFDFKKPTNQMVWRIIQTLTENRYPRPAESDDAGVPEWVRECKKLPPLSKDSVGQWAEIGWKAMLDAFDGKPERHSELYNIGYHRKNRARNADSEEGYIRSEIKAEIKPALSKLVR